MAAYSTYTDQELVALLKEGDHNAFAQIYDRYWSVLYLHAKHMLRDAERAGDVVQEVFVWIWDKHTQVDMSSSLKAYLYRSVKNTILNIIRHEKVKENYFADFKAYYSEGTPDTDELLRYNELKRLIDKEIELLPPKMREVFELSRNEGLSYAEIGEKLGISDLTAKKHVSKALTILRRKLNIPLGLLLFILKDLN